MTKWIPTNKWIAAQGVFATALVSSGFDSGWDKGEAKLGIVWGIQAVVTYLTSNKRLPDDVPTS